MDPAGFRAGAWGGDEFQMRSMAKHVKVLSVAVGRLPQRGLELGASSCNSVFQPGASEAAPVQDAPQSWPEDACGRACNRFRKSVVSSSPKICCASCELGVMHREAELAAAVSSCSWSKLCPRQRSTWTGGLVSNFKEEVFGDLVRLSLCSSFLNSFYSRDIAFPPGSYA